MLVLPTRVSSGLSPQPREEALWKPTGKKEVGTKEWSFRTDGR